MKIDTFIFVHDQKIILDFINSGKFKTLPNLKFLFLGGGEIDKIKNIENVIISRELRYNIENYPKLTSFTGWYSIWKNNLSNSEYINLFEYDINISDNFNEIQNKKLVSNGIIGYIPFSPHHHNFIGHTPWIYELGGSIQKKYNTNIKEFLKKIPKDFICSMTSNHTFDSDTFEKYMKWMEPMIDDIKISNFSGHMTERSISLFYILNSVKNVIIPDILFHFQLDSHGTQNIPKEKFINNYDKLVKNGL
jgi:hypothetical protein